MWEGMHETYLAPNRSNKLNVLKTLVKHQFPQNARDFLSNRRIISFSKTLFHAVTYTTDGFVDTSFEMQLS